MLNRLAKIQGLRVAARTSSFQFKEKTEDLRTIADKLNVSTILEGSVRTQGTRVRITAQLIKASDGFQLWSDTYDRELRDIFGVQDDIARAVAGSLQVTLLGGVKPAQGTNVEAYNAVLQARYFWGRGSKQNLERAAAYFEQAIKLDPNYAPAWLVLQGSALTRRMVATSRLNDGNWEGPGCGGRGAGAGSGPSRTLTGPTLRSRGLTSGTRSAAEAAVQRVLALEPGNTSALSSAGNLCLFPWAASTRGYSCFAAL